MLRYAALSLLIVAFVSPAMAGDVIVLRGEIGRDTTLRRNRTYLLQGLVTVKAGTTLRIRPGTTVNCDIGSTLVVERGAKLRAEGTAERPIVFTSAQVESSRRRGDWGGIVVNGRAPVNIAGGVGYGEGGTGAFGGYEADDGSGSLRYVRIEYAGFPVGAEGRADALALRGVGSATTVEFVEALNGDGDGVAVVGGTVDLRYVASVGNSRRGLSWSKGWTGGAQFLLVQQRRDVPASSYEAIHAETSTPKVANVTIAGSSVGVRFGSGARGVYRNLVVVGCREAGLDLRDAANFDDLRRGDLEVGNAIFHANRGGENFDPAVRAALGSSAIEQDPLLLNSLDEAAPDFRPRDGSPAFSEGNVGAPPVGAVFIQTSFAGAFGSVESGSWLGAWANFETPPEPRYLANAQTSPEALTRSFLDSLAASDIPGMKRLRITKKEFCWYVWPELPASQLPNISCDFAWSQATLNSLAGLSSVLSDYGGRRFELVSLRFAGGSEVYPSYVVHKDTRVTIRDENGQEHEVRLFGSMLELDGTFKLFSFVVD